mmetsp:Transcript_58163/g.65024  ORF Transcript_58163/g.65024 Transcript_58163/m.65024 type:complete len:90 (-) Transcript_58163:340-609(-)
MNQGLPLAITTTPTTVIEKVTTTLLFDGRSHRKSEINLKPEYKMNKTMSKKTIKENDVVGRGSGSGSSSSSSSMYGYNIMKYRNDKSNK